MRLQNKWLVGAIMGAVVCVASTSCVDEIKFGNSFLEKAPEGLLPLIRFLTVPSIRASS